MGNKKIYEEVKDKIVGLLNEKIEKEIAFIIEGMIEFDKD